MAVQQAADRLGLLPSTSVSSGDHDYVYEVNFRTAEILRLYCGESAEYKPTGGPGQGRSKGPCDDRFRRYYQEQLRRRRAMLALVIELEIYKRIVANLQIVRDGKAEMRAQLDPPESQPATWINEEVDGRVFQKQYALTANFLKAAVLTLDPVMISSLDVEDPGFKLDARGAIEQVGWKFIKAGASREYGEGAKEAAEHWEQTYEALNLVVELGKSTEQSKTLRAEEEHGADDLKKQQARLAASLTALFGDLDALYSKEIFNPMVFASGARGSDTDRAAGQARSRAFEALRSLSEALWKLTHAYDTKALPVPCQESFWVRDDPNVQVPGQIPIPWADIEDVIEGKKTARQLAESVASALQ